MANDIAGAAESLGANLRLQSPQRQKQQLDRQRGGQAYIETDCLSASRA